MTARRNAHRSDEIVTFDQIKGTIGSLVSLWSWTERALEAAIRQMHAGERPKSAHGIARSIDLWSQGILRNGDGREPQVRLCRRVAGLLNESCRIRNLVCHGLDSIHARTHRSEAEAHLRVELDGEKRILTWSELDEMFSWMSRVPWVIRDLTAASMEKDAQRGNDRIAGLVDFPFQK